MTTSVQDIQAQIAALKQAQKAAKKDERIAARAAAKHDKMVQAEVLYKEFIAKLEGKGIDEKDFRRYVKSLRNEVAVEVETAVEVDADNYGIGGVTGLSWG